MPLARHICMAIGVMMAIPALVLLLFDERYEDEFGKCVTLGFHNCTNLDKRQIPDTFQIGPMTINMGIVIAMCVFLVYLCVAFGVVYARILGLPQRMVHFLDQHPKTKLFLVAVFNAMMNIIVNICCSRLCGYIKNEQEMRFLIFLQVSCMFFLMGGVTTTDFGFIDALTAMALNLPLIKFTSAASYLPNAIRTSAAGAARYITVPAFIYYIETQRRAREGQIEIQLEGENQIQMSEEDVEMLRMINVMVDRICKEIDEASTTISKSSITINELEDEMEKNESTQNIFLDSRYKVKALRASDELDDATVLACDAREKCTNGTSIKIAIEEMERAVTALERALAATATVINMEIEMKQMVINHYIDMHEANN